LEETTMSRARSSRNKKESRSGGLSRGAPPRAVRAGLRTRIGLLAGSAAAVGAIVAFLLWPSARTGGAVDRSVEITMGGFAPQVIAASAGTPLRLELINPDSSLHTDGGGWHQLAIPALGVDGRVAPKSRAVVDLPAAAPGDYPFYCDVCCGGKENPSMQGVLRVV
jgi:hypothetical protein